MCFCYIKSTPNQPVRAGEHIHLRRIRNQLSKSANFCGGGLSVYPKGQSHNARPNQRKNRASCSFPPLRCYCQYDNRKSANNQAIFTKCQKARKVLRNAGLSHSYLRNSAIFFEIMKDSLHFFDDIRNLWIEVGKYSGIGQTSGRTRATCACRVAVYRPPIGLFQKILV